MATAKSDGELPAAVSVSVPARFVCCTASGTAPVVILNHIRVFPAFLDAITARPMRSATVHFDRDLFIAAQIPAPPHYAYSYSRVSFICNRVIYIYVAVHYSSLALPHLRPRAC